MTTLLLLLKLQLPIQLATTITWFMVYHNLGVISSLDTTSIMIIVLKTEPNKNLKKENDFWFFGLTGVEMMVRLMTL